MHVIIRLIICFWLMLLTACTLAKQETPLVTAIANFQAENYGLAYSQLKPLAAAGDPVAQYGLGYLYFYGMGIPKDQVTAKLWIRRAAYQKYPQAIEALSLINQHETTLSPLTPLPATE